MSFLAAFEHLALKSIDLFYALRPQTVPVKDELRNCKIVSHRGEHDNRTVYENTLAAFDLALQRGVWGIEFDVRWTKDLHPVVLHDPDLQRVFGSRLIVREATAASLRTEFPQIPFLVEVVERYAGKLHLMVEIKAESYPKAARQNQILKDCFASLEPEFDYHLMTLTPQMFELITFASPSALIPIARLHVSEFSRLALEKRYCGIAGHYFLLNSRILERHRKENQLVGTGYPGSKNCLFREINRGIEWIFSNNAGEIQAIANRLI